MTKRTVVMATCNLCTQETEYRADQLNTVNLALEGQGYSLDLCDDHLLEVKGALQTYIAQADPVGKKSSSSGSSTPGGATATQLGLDPAKVREWARGSGYDVPEVGRLNQDILNAYMAATGVGSQATPEPAAL